MSIEIVARFGYFTKGIVYFLLGLLSVQIVLGETAQTSDTTGVLEVIAAQPLGKLQLSIIVAGLAAYVLWRFLQAIFDPEHTDEKSGRIVQRLGCAASGFSYAGLALSALRLILFDQSDRSSTKSWTAILLSQPFGRWLVALLGLAIIGVATSYFYRSFTQFKQLNVDSQAKWAVQISRFGIAARGFVFCLIGIFFIRSALQYDPQEARGLDGTLHTLAQQPFGKLCLCIVALGFMAYGVYMFVEARYRQMVAMPSLSSKSST